MLFSSLVTSGGSVLVHRLVTIQIVTGEFEFDLITTFSPGSEGANRSAVPNMYPNHVVRYGFPLWSRAGGRSVRHFFLYGDSHTNEVVPS